MEFLSSLFTDFGAQILTSSTAAFAIAAIGVNIHFGYTGLLNFGQAGFMLIGAYGFALTVIYTGSFWLAVLMSIVAAVLFAFILGLPTVKLRGDYLAIVTIAAAEIIRIVGGNALLEPYTGGVAGILGSRYQPAFQALSFLPKTGTWTLGPYTYPYTEGDSWWLRIVGWGLVAIICVIVWLLMRSPWGRVLRGIREDEDAVRSLGKNVFAYKMQSLIIGGVVFVLSSSVQPDSLGRTTTFLIYTCLLLGGAASIFGPVLGSILYFVLRIGIEDVANQFIPSSIMNSQQVPQFAWVVVGVGLMCLVIFRPQGILGNKKELAFDD